MHQMQAEQPKIIFYLVKTSQPQPRGETHARKTKKHVNGWKIVFLRLYLCHVTAILLWIQRAPSRRKRDSKLRLRASHCHGDHTTRDLPSFRSLFSIFSIFLPSFRGALSKQCGGGDRIWTNAQTPQLGPPLV